MYNPKSPSSKSYYALMEKLIQEVKSRPVLWDKSQKRCHRNKIAREWVKIGEILKKDPLDMKSKWRNVKDTFHREAKKMKIPPPEKRDQPIIEYYEGQWLHFENLLFLWDEVKFGNQGGETDKSKRQDFVSIEITEDKLKKNIIMKHEITDSENDTDGNNESEYQDQDSDTEDIPIQDLFNKDTLDALDPIGRNSEGSRKSRGTTSDAIITGSRASHFFR
ncbi:hypothetical protein evm_000195 [Chilo suppressalis]|nr:hypothetical protein evm_000195 [Chilo suppressalis]